LNSSCRTLAGLKPQPADRSCLNGPGHKNVSPIPVREKLDANPSAPLHIPPCGTRYRFGDRSCHDSLDLPAGLLLAWLAFGSLPRGASAARPTADRPMLRGPTALWWSGALVAGWMTDLQSFIKSKPALLKHSTPAVRGSPREAGPIKSILEPIRCCRTSAGARSGPGRGPRFESPCCRSMIVFIALG